MRRFVIAAALTLAVAACATSEPLPQPDVTPDHDPGYPVGYSSWTQSNTTTITREDEGIAREIFANVVGDLEVGSVLVKEQYRFAGGRKGELFELAVMRRTGSGDHNGWSFEAYDPQSKRKKTTHEDACIGCHIIRAGTDYLFATKARYTR